MQANGMIFWDWNGTLMDDLDFTHGCLNWMLETHGYPQRYDLAAYREIFGFPIEEYYIRAGFDFARHPYPELAECFMAHYNAGVDACPPSAHAAETLAELSRQGWRACRAILLSCSALQTSMASARCRWAGTGLPKAASTLPPA